MKYKYTCDVESKTLIHSNIKFVDGDYEYEFIPDKTGLLCEMSITAKVHKPELFWSLIENSDEPGVSKKLTINGDKVLLDSIIERFHSLEAALSLSGGMKKIRWEEPKGEVICESEEEQKNVNLFGVHWHMEYPDNSVLVEERSLKLLVSSHEDYNALKYLLSFWREGELDYKAKRYVDAFHNFYYVIEGFYGDGNTKNSLVEKAFIENKRFQDVFKSVLKSLSDKKKKEEVESLLRIRGKNLNLEGIVHLLVITRGELHHFNPKRVRGTSFNHQEYHALSWLAMGFAIHSLLLEVVEINLKREGL